jgi:putative membrane protein
MKTTSSEHRLHPISVVFEIGRRLPRLMVPVIVLFFATQTQRTAALLVIPWIAAFGVVAVIVSIAQYLRFSYRYGATELVIRSGLFTRNERSIPYARIQNLDAAQNPLHRLFNVAVVHVQTGGSAESEASLRVLQTTALQEMRKRVLQAGGRTGSARLDDPSLEADATSGMATSLEADTTSGLTTTDAASPDTAMVESATLPGSRHQLRPLLALQTRELVLAGFIENRGMVLIVGALALFEQTGAIGRLIERVFQDEGASVRGLAERWLGGTDVPVAQGVLYAAAALLVILLFIRLLSTIWAVVRLYDFRLDRVGDELHTEYGLFTRVSATIPLRRVQTVIIRDGLLHRLLGRHEVLVETAGGAIVEAGARQREPIAPILRAEQLPALLVQLQPGLDTRDVAWKPVHRRAFGRMLRGALLWPAGLSAAAYFLVQTWAIAVLAVLVTYAILHAVLRARYLAWDLTRDSIVVRDGALARTTRITRFSRVQVIAIVRNPFDLRTGMSTVRADTAGARGSGVAVPYLPEETATAVHAELVARTEATAFTW